MFLVDPRPRSDEARGEKDLWLQELVQKRRLHMLKINGLVNVADTLTKCHDQVTCSCSFSNKMLGCSAKYSVIAMNRVCFANTQFLNEMSTFMGDFVSSKW